MNRVQIVRGIADVGWWVFVVAMLLVSATFGAGWTAYVPLTDAATNSSLDISDFDPVAQFNAVSTIGAIGLGATVTASIVAALWLPGRRTKAVAIAAPIVGALVVWFATTSGITVYVLAEFLVVITGIAIRETGSRWALGRLPMCEVS
ncbi:hypothetical protein [Tsukamurella paurometabola]|uniref:hypothetical protein n=1 Tax=Tsukamurella paurometabola TaxID=2061 RepID=UPI00019F085B|nr:hypothetical protein [Tsukamurella paurometabola]